MPRVGAMADVAMALDNKAAGGRAAAAHVGSCVFLCSVFCVYCCHKTF